MFAEDIHPRCVHCGEIRYDNDECCIACGEEWDCSIEEQPEASKPLSIDELDWGSLYDAENCNDQPKPR